MTTTTDTTSREEADMRHRRVDIIGGGPAGLYAARLLKVSRPDWTVTVHERMRGTRGTFGFGVVLTGSTMDNLARADPTSAADIRAAGHFGHGLRMRRDTEQIDLHGAGNLAIGRKTLLEVLAVQARAAGVVISTGDHVEASALDSDIVIAADGVRSTTREKLATELGAEVSIGRGLFLWCGADFALTDSMFSPVRTEHGLFVAHAYPYAVDRSTFLIETDDTSWRAAGMDQTDAAAARHASDESSLQYLQDAFADDLAGHRLLGNRSRWQRFHTVHLDRWSHGNTVLIGDAAHTAHYTLGSGTKLALEDAISVVDAMLADDDVPTAFAHYEQARRPTVTRFQRLAARSQRWWESFSARIDQPLPTLAASFMTRAGNIDLDRLSRHAGGLLLDALRCYSARVIDDLPDDITQWVLDQPLDPGTGTPTPRVIDSATTLPSPITTIEWSEPDPWGPAGDIAVNRARANGGTVWLRGMNSTPALQGRLDLAERLKLELRATVVVDLPADARTDAAAALTCGRGDLVHLTGENHSE